MKVIFRITVFGKNNLLNWDRRASNFPRFFGKNSMFGKFRLIKILIKLSKHLKCKLYLFML